MLCSGSGKERLFLAVFVIKSRFYIINWKTDQIAKQDSKSSKRNSDCTSLTFRQNMQTIRDKKFTNDTVRRKLEQHKTL